MTTSTFLANFRCLSHWPGVPTVTSLEYMILPIEDSMMFPILFLSEARKHKPCAEGLVNIRGKPRQIGKECFSRNILKICMAGAGSYSLQLNRRFDL